MSEPDEAGLQTVYEVYNADGKPLPREVLYSYIDEQGRRVSKPALLEGPADVTKAEYDAKKKKTAPGRMVIRPREIEVTREKNGQYYAVKRHIFEIRVNFAEPGKPDRWAPVCGVPLFDPLANNEGKGFILLPTPAEAPSAPAAPAPEAPAIPPVEPPEAPKAKKGKKPAD